MTSNIIPYVIISLVNMKGGNRCVIMKPSHHPSESEEKVGKEEI